MLRYDAIVAHGPLASARQTLGPQTGATFMSTTVTPAHAEQRQHIRVSLAYLFGAGLVTHDRDLESTRMKLGASGVSKVVVVVVVVITRGSRTSEM